MDFNKLPESIIPWKYWETLFHLYEEVKFPCDFQDGKCRRQRETSKHWDDGDYDAEMGYCEEPYADFNEIFSEDEMLEIYMKIDKIFLSHGYIRT